MIHHPHSKCSHVTYGDLQIVRTISFNVNICFRNFRAQNTLSLIYELIRDLAGDRQTIKISDVMERCTTKGFKPDQVDKCMDEYETLNVWQVNQTRTNITFVQWFRSSHHMLYQQLSAHLHFYIFFINKLSHFIWIFRAEHFWFVTFVVRWFFIFIVIIFNSIMHFCLPRNTSELEINFESSQ